MGGQGCREKGGRIKWGRLLGVPSMEVGAASTHWGSPLCILPSLPALLYSEMDRLSVKLEKGCLKNRSVPLMDVGMWAHAI